MERFRPWHIFKISMKSSDSPLCLTLSCPGGELCDARRQRGNLKARSGTDIEEIKEKTKLHRVFLPSLHVAGLVDRVDPTGFIPSLRCEKPVYIIFRMI